MSTNPSVSKQSLYAQLLKVSWRMCTHNVLFQVHFHQPIKHHYSFSKPSLLSVSSQLVDDDLYKRCKCSQHVRAYRLTHEIQISMETDQIRNKCEHIFQIIC